MFANFALLQAYKLLDFAVELGEISLFLIMSWLIFSKIVILHALYSLKDFEVNIEIDAHFDI